MLAKFNFKYETFWSILNKGNVYGEMDNLNKIKFCRSLADIYQDSFISKNFKEKYLYHDHQGFENALKPKGRNVRISNRQLYHIVLYILTTDKSSTLTKHHFKIEDLNMLLGELEPSTDKHPAAEKETFRVIKEEIIEKVSGTEHSKFPPLTIDNNWKVKLKVEEKEEEIIVGNSKFQISTDVDEKESNQDIKFPPFQKPNIFKRIGYSLQDFFHQGKKEAMFYLELGEALRDDMAGSRFLQNYIRIDYKNNEEKEGEKRQKNLVKHLWGRVILNKAPAKKIHFVLAGTGMGKTVCLAKLYMRYLQNRHRYQVGVFLLPFDGSLDSNLKTLCKKLLAYQNERKKRGLNKIKTVLLLDGLDEDSQANQDLEKRLGQLNQDYFYSFNNVILSSRFHFFQSEEKIVEVLTLLDTRDIGGFYYIQPFTNNQVNRYLTKRFKSGEGEKKAKYSRSIQLKKHFCDNNQLLSRQFLLANLDVLFDMEDKRVYEFQSKADLYDAMTKRWAELEGEKIHEQEFSDGKGGTFTINKKDYKDYVLKFSKELAKQDYLVRKEFPNADKIENRITQSAFEKANIPEQKANVLMKSRALLTRTPDGDMKFAFRVFRDFFVAIAAYDSAEFDREFDFDSEHVGKNEDNAGSYYLQLFWFRDIKKFLDFCYLKDWRLGFQINSGKKDDIELEFSDILKVQEIVSDTKPNANVNFLLQEYNKLPKKKGEEGYCQIDFYKVLLRPFRNIKRLNLSELSLTDVDFLGNLKSLEQLGLSRNPIKNISGLSSLSHLLYLGLYKSNIQDFSPLKNLKNLKTLHGGMSIKPITILNHFSDLESLTIVLEEDQVENLEVLGSFPKLHTLNILNPLSRIEILNHFPEIKTLRVRLNDTEDIIPIKRLGNLRALYLGYPTIPLIKHLLSIEAELNLHLYYYESPISTDEFELLKKFKKITVLGFSEIHLHRLVQIPDKGKLKKYYQLEDFFFNRRLELFTGTMNVQRDKPFDLNNLKHLPIDEVVLNDRISLIITLGDGNMKRFTTTVSNFKDVVSKYNTFEVNSYFRVEELKIIGDEKGEGNFSISPCWQPVEKFTFQSDEDFLGLEPYLQSLPYLKKVELSGFAVEGYFEEVHIQKIFLNIPKHNFEFVLVDLGIKTFEVLPFISDNKIIHLDLSSNPLSLEGADSLKNLSYLQSLTLSKGLFGKNELQTLKGFLPPDCVIHLSNSNEEIS